MKKPLLIVLTGRPASGKTTLAHLLTTKIQCPLISRDEMKEGYITTHGAGQSMQEDATALHIYKLFFEAVDLMVSNGVSVIAEAAFQDNLWKPKLLGLQQKVHIKIIICAVPGEVAADRFAQRLLSDPRRQTFHADDLLKKTAGLKTCFYQPVNIDAPLLTVDTTNGYNPGVDKIIRFIQQTN
ncbi:MAG TPA: AAA family ATPase [Chitinophagaceae bacterium]|nr:AAA family ATPase [Chitinophagaceae bacterium]